MPGEFQLHVSSTVGASSDLCIWQKLQSWEVQCVSISELNSCLYLQQLLCTATSSYVYSRTYKKVCNEVLRDNYCTKLCMYIHIFTYICTVVPFDSISFIPPSINSSALHTGVGGIQCLQMVQLFLHCVFTTTQCLLLHSSLIIIRAVNVLRALNHAVASTGVAHGNISPD